MFTFPKPSRATSDHRTRQCSVLLMLLLLVVNHVLPTVAWDVHIHCCDNPNHFPNCERRQLPEGVPDQGDADFDIDAFLENPDLWETEKEDLDPFELVDEDEEKHDELEVEESEREDADEDTMIRSEILHLRRGDGEKPTPKGLSQYQTQRDLVGQGVPYLIKMHWEEHFCWQAEKRERQWCMECQGKDCDSGDRLWTMQCDASNSRQWLEWAPVDNTYGQIKVHNRNLCLERISTNHFKLYKCNQNLSTQQFRGFKQNEPFQIKPKGMGDKCLTNFWHHPKAQEFIYATNCGGSEDEYTDRWAVFGEGDWPLPPPNVPNGSSSSTQPSNTAAPPRPQAADRSSSSSTKFLSLTVQKGCAKTNTCGECVGDCNNDEDCAGKLVCSKKKGAGYVDGCEGYDNSRTDFCVQPQYRKTTKTKNKTKNGRAGGEKDAPARTAAATESTTTKAKSGTSYGTDTTLRMSKKARGKCSRRQPCDLCEGDCNTDADCMEGLSCYKKKGPGKVDGCVGFDNSRTDFCYKET